METFSYREPAIGQAILNFKEGISNLTSIRDSFAGCYFVVCCYGSGRHPHGKVALDAVWKYKSIFED